MLKAHTVAAVVHARWSPNGPVSWGEEMDVAAVRAALGGEAGEPCVLVRLFLVAADQVTGEQQVVSTFVKKLAVPPAMVGPGVHVALHVLGARRVFKPTSVIWDEVHRVCILEIAWVVADHAALADTLEPEESWTA